MSVIDTSTLYGCEHCRYADAYGRNCQHGLMFPVLLVMTNHRVCPNYKLKTEEQFKERKEKEI